MRVQVRLADAAREAAVGAALRGGHGAGGLERVQRCARGVSGGGGGAQAGAGLGGAGGGGGAPDGGRGGPGRRRGGRGRRRGGPGRKRGGGGGRPGWVGGKPDVSRPALAESRALLGALRS